MGTYIGIGADGSVPFGAFRSSLPARVQSTQNCQGTTCNTPPDSVSAPLTAFYISLFLAEHVTEIVEMLFQYLSLLRREGSQENLFQECAVSEGVVGVREGGCE